MLPLPWPDINYFISSDNELLFTLRKLPKGNYGILKINSEEDPFLYMTRSSRHLPPLKCSENFFGRSSPSGILSTTPRPRLHRLLLLTVLLLLQHLLQQNHHLPHSAVWVACDYSSSSVCPASTAPASFSPQRRVLTLRRGEDCGLTAGISDVSLPASQLVTSLPMPCPAFSQHELRHSPGPHTAARLRPGARGGREDIKTSQICCQQLSQACYASLQQRQYL